MVLQKQLYSRQRKPALRHKRRPAMQTIYAFAAHPSLILSCLLISKDRCLISRDDLAVNPVPSIPFGLAEFSASVLAPRYFGDRFLQFPMQVLPTIPIVTTDIGLLSPQPIVQEVHNE